MDPRLHRDARLFDNSRNRTDGTPIPRASVTGFSGLSGLAMPISVKELAYRSHNREVPRTQLTPADSTPRRSQSAATGALGERSGGRGSHGAETGSGFFPHAAQNAFAARLAPTTTPLYGAGSGLADFDARPRTSSSGLHGTAAGRTLSDFALLSNDESIDAMSSEELYSYASRMKEERRNASADLATAYSARDQYREELARLKVDLHNKMMQLQLANVDREKYQATIQKLHEDIASLRSQLDEAEGRARQWELRHHAQPTALNTGFLQTQLATKDGLIAQLESEKYDLEARLRDALERALAQAERDNAGAEHSAALQSLERELAEMAAAKDELARRLNAAQDRGGDETASLAKKNRHLEDELDRVKAQNARLQEDVDRLSDSLASRAPLSTTDYHAFQHEFGEARRLSARLAEEHDALKTALAGLEATALEVPALQESLLRAEQERDDALARLAQLEARNAKLETLAQSFQQEVDLSGEANQLRQDELDRLRDLLQQAQDEKEAADDRNADLEARLAASEGKGDDTVAKLTRELDDLRHELANNKEALERVAVLAQERDSPTRAAAPADTSADDEKVALEAALDALRAKLSETIADNSELSARLAAEQNRVQTLEAELLTAQASVADLASDLRKAQSEADTSALDAHVKDLEKKLANALAAVSELANTMETEREANTKLTAELEETKAARQLLEAQNKSLEATNQSLEQQLADARAAIDELAAEVAEKNQQLAVLQADVAGKDRALEQLQDVLHKLESANAATAEGAQTLAELVTENGALHQANATLEQQLSNALGAVNKMADDLAEKNRQLSDTQAHLASLRTEHAATAAELQRQSTDAAHLSSLLQRTSGELVEAKALEEAARHALELESELKASRAELSNTHAALSRVAAELHDARTHNADLAGEMNQSAAGAHDAATTRARLDHELAVALQAVQKLANQLNDKTVALEALRSELEAAQLSDSQRAERIASLEKDLAHARAELEQLRRDLHTQSQRVDELLSELQGLRRTSGASESARDASVRELAAAHAALDQMTRNYVASEEALSAARAAHQLLEAQNKSLEATNQSLEQQLADARAAIDELAAEVAEKNQQLAVLQADVAGKDRALEQLQDVLHKLESANATTAEGAQTLAELVTENGALHQTNATLEQQLSNALGAVNKMADDLAEKNRQLSETQAHLATALRTVKALEDTLHTEQHASSTSADASQHSRAVLEEEAHQRALDLDAAREEEARLLHALSEANMTERNLRDTNESLAAALAEARAELDKRAEALASLDRAKADAERDRDALTSALRTAQADAGSQDTATLHDQAELANTREAMQQLADTLTELRATLQNAESQNQSLTRALATKSAALDAVQAAKADLENRVTDLSAHVDGESQNVAALRASVHELLKSLSNAHEAINRLSQQVAGYQVENAHLSTKLSESTAAEQSLAAALSALQEATENATKPALARARDELALTKNALADAESRAAQHAADLEALMKQLANTRAALFELAASYERGQQGLGDSHAALQLLASTTTAERAAFDSERTDLQAQLAALRTALARSEQGRVDAEAALGRVAAELSAARARLDSLPALEAALSHEKGVAAWLRQELSATQEALQQVSSQLVSQDALLARLDEENKSLNEAVEQGLAANAALSADVTALTAERTDLQQQIAAHKEALSQTAGLYMEEVMAKEELRAEVEALNRALVHRGEAVREAYAHLDAATRAVATSLRAALDRSAYHLTDGTPLHSAAVAVTTPSFLDLVAPVQNAYEWMQKQPSELIVQPAARSHDQDDAGSRSAALADTAPIMTHASATRAVRGLVALLDEVCAGRRDCAGRIGGLLMDARTARAALDQLAAQNIAAGDRTEDIVSELQSLEDRLAETRTEYERQLTEQQARAAEELVATRLTAERADEARRRAEDQLGQARAELDAQARALDALKSQNDDINREKERLTRLTSMMPDADRRRRATLQAEDLSLLGAGLTDSFDAVEQAQMLQISSLQADLLLKRRQVKELEGKEAALRETYNRGQQQLADMAAEVESVNEILQERDRYRELYEESLDTYNRLVDSTNASATAVSENRALRERVAALASELEAEKQRSYRLAVAQSASASAAGRQSLAFPQQHEALAARSSALFDAVDAVMLAADAEPSERVAAKGRVSGKARASSDVPIPVRETLGQLKKLSMDQEKALKAALTDNQRKDEVIETLRKTLGEADTSPSSSPSASKTGARTRLRAMDSSVDVAATPRAAAPQLNAMSLLTPLAGDMSALHIPSPSPRLPVMPRRSSLDGDDDDREEDAEEEEESSISPRLSTVSRGRGGPTSTSQGTKRPRSGTSRSSSAKTKRARK